MKKIVRDSREVFNIGLVLCDIFFYRNRKKHDAYAQFILHIIKNLGKCAYTIKERQSWMTEVLWNNEYQERKAKNIL